MTEDGEWHKWVQKIAQPVSVGRGLEQDMPEKQEAFNLPVQGSPGGYYDLDPLKGYQKKFLRGLSHGIKPVVLIGQKGLTPAVIDSVNEALDAHELIKIRFLEFKEKKQKSYIAREIELKTGSSMAGMIGNTATFYRQHPDPEKRRIKLPRRESAGPPL